MALVAAVAVPAEVGLTLGFQFGFLAVATAAAAAVAATPKSDTKFTNIRLGKPLQTRFNAVSIKKAPGAFSGLDAPASLG